MTKVEQKGQGWLFADKMYFGDEDAGSIQLRLSKGSEMRYVKDQAHVIDFPGEYDIQGVSVSCLEADAKLSYVVHIDGKKIALLQNAAVLEVHNFDAIEAWYCMDAGIKGEIESLEMAGDVYVLGETTTAADQE